VGVGMQLLGLPFATLLGVLAFFFEFIPFLGPLFSAVACLLVGASLGWVTMALVLVYFVFIHIIEGYVVGPRVLGRSLGLHPAISIVALLVGGEVFGLWGALFAAPIAGIVQVVLSALWTEWRESHPTQFPDEDDQAEEDLPEPALNIFNSPPDAAPTPATSDAELSGAPGQAIKPGAAQRTAQPDAPTP
jgi:predicted PurR-regulated permease PerM